MQNAERILDNENKFGLVTKHGKTKGRIMAVPVAGHRVLVAVEPVAFDVVTRRKPAIVTYPEGTGYMYHGEIGKYQIFPGGMYDMMRSKAHASRGERYESKDMREMVQLTFDFYRRLRTWALLDDEGKHLTDEGLLALAEENAFPKRNDRKLTASARYRKAAELRTKKNGRRMPMPSAFTASAGAYHLDRRREDVCEILRWVDPERLAVFGLVEGVHLRLDDAWRALRPEEIARSGNAIALAAARPTDLTIRVMRDAVRPVYEGLYEIRVRPLNGHAAAAAHALDDLLEKIGRATTSVDVSDELAKARRALATAHAIRIVEMEAISPLSFLLARWLRLDGVQRELVRRRTVERGLRLRDALESRLEFLPEATRTRVRDEVALAAEIASRRDDVDPRKRLLAVKKVLKRLSASLI